MLCDYLEGWDEGTGEGGSTGKGYVCVCVCVCVCVYVNYDWFALLYYRNQHNIIKQFSSSQKINSKEKTSREV